jgi:hypothetical protein
MKHPIQRPTAFPLWQAEHKVLSLFGRMLGNSEENSILFDKLGKNGAYTFRIENFSVLVDM